MRLTASSRLRSITPQMVFGAMCIESAYREVGVECIVTSAHDKKHGRNSLHFSGNAVDFRTKNVPRAKLDGLVQRCRKNCGVDFEVILEFRDEEQEHLHCEYQPEVA